MSSTAIINIQRSTFDKIITRLNAYDAGICNSQSTESARDAPNDTAPQQQTFLERFLNITRSWNPEAVWRTVNNFPPSMVDEMIEKCQQRVEDNAPLPKGAVRRLIELRRENVWKPNMIELKKLLAAGVVQEK